MSQFFEVYARDALLVLTLGWWLLWCVKPPRGAVQDTYRRAALSEVVDALMSSPDAPGRSALRAAGQALPSQDLDKGLNEIRRRDARFDPAYFLENVRNKYVSVLRAYAAGDLKALSAHVSQDVLNALSPRIHARTENGEPDTPDIRDVPAPEMLGAGVTAGSAWIVVLCMPSTGTSRANADVWVFARDIGAPRTTWMLVATSAGAIGQTP